MHGQQYIETKSTCSLHLSAGTKSQGLKDFKQW